MAAVGARQAVEQLDAAVMILEYLHDDRQAEPGALGARGHVGFDQFMAILVGKSLAVVADGNAREAVGVEPQDDADLAAFFGSIRSASMPSLAFLSTLVSACEISRRSNSAVTGSSGRSSSIAISGRPMRMRNNAWRTQSERSSGIGRALGMRAKEENSSTMRLMSSTWRMMVSVH